MMKEKTEWEIAAESGVIIVKQIKKKILTNC